MQLTETCCKKVGNEGVKIHRTELSEVLIVEPDAFPDKRGYFMETYHREKYEQLGIGIPFVQDNLSYSVFGTVRGLHYQYPQGQAKLVQAIMGEIFDVVVDVRRGSPTFGRWAGLPLSEENKNQLFVPAGFAHGFCAVSEIAVVSYKCSEFYAPENERGILWSDPDLNIVWPVKEPILSSKDSEYPCLRDVVPGALPHYGS